MHIMAAKIINISLPLFIAMMVVCAIGAQYIMQPKGYSATAARAVGALLGPIGVLIAFLLPNKNESTHSESDKAKALREYKKLLDDGTITEEEFYAKKKELLS